MFSQNGEDIIIDELLGHLQNGFYIDCGAGDPNRISVTKYFYDKGWTGINIEPLIECYMSFMHFRQRDINLNVAVGSENGELKLMLFGDLSTFNEELGSSSWAARMVQVLTLKDICDKYVGDKQIDFLKIDVEGWEKQVILGADWVNYKPKVLCIEFARPGSETDYNSKEWEPILFNAGYKHVEKKQDKYNRYYILEN
jgi:FkbM family methyltransferase